MTTCTGSCDHSAQSWALRDGLTGDLVHKMHTAENAETLSDHVSDALGWVAFYARHGRVEQAGRLAVLFKGAQVTAIDGWVRV